MTSGSAGTTDTGPTGEPPPGAAAEEEPASETTAAEPGADAPPPGPSGGTGESASSGPPPAVAGPDGSEAAAGTPDAPSDLGWTPVIVRVPPTGAEAVSAGPRSPEVCLVPQDLYPPAPPADLRAFWQTEGTDLNWEASAAPDVAGYRVYRSATDDSGYELLAETPADVLAVTDRDRDPGTEYTYTVTAVDAAGTPNESPRSAPVRVRPRRP